MYNSLARLSPLTSPPPLSPTPTCGLAMTKQPEEVLSVSAQFISEHDGANPSLGFYSRSVVLAILLTMIITLACSRKSFSLCVSLPPSLSLSAPLSLSLFPHICRNIV